MSRRKLLLADDSITIQKVVNLTFADEGIDVISVSDGDAALAQLSAETPDILLADVNMPGPTGYEICERLRANEATRNVPVILLVGSFEPFDETEAARVGANAYLTKPFQSIKQLISQVNELMETSSQTPAAEVSPTTNESEAVTIESSTDQLSAAAEPASSRPEETVAAAPESPAPRQFDDLGYETTYQPSAEPVEQAAQPADDIDSLYTQSISGDAELSDVGIDDEMIETSYSAPESTEAIGSFESVPAAATEEPAEAPPVIEEQDAKPEAMPNLATTESEVGFRSGYDQRFPEDPSKFENTISYENWQPADMRGEESVTTTVNPLETAPLNETGPQPVEPATAPARVGDDTVRMENRFDTSGSSSFKFDDTDLLDLSPSAEQPVEITSPVNALEQGSTKQLVTLSPELIEMIAQRVVEKLSEKY